MKKEMLVVLAAFFALFFYWIFGKMVAIVGALIMVTIAFSLTMCTKKSKTEQESLTTTTETPQNKEKKRKTTRKTSKRKAAPSKCIFAVL